MEEMKPRITNFSAVMKLSTLFQGWFYSKINKEKVFLHDLDSPFNYRHVI